MRFLMLLLLVVMAMTFPANPALGQEYCGHIWNGSQWQCFVALPDAPRDGVLYGRLNGVWTPALSANGGEILNLTVDGTTTTTDLTVSGGATINNLDAGAINTNSLQVAGPENVTGGALVVTNEGVGGAAEFHDSGQGDDYCLQVYSDLTGFLEGFWWGGGANTVQPNAIFVGSIEYNISTGLTLFNATSDGDLKTDAHPASATVISKIIDGLTPKQFKWKDQKNGIYHLGLIAQEVWNVFPDAVTPARPSTAGRPSTPWMVDYSKLVPLLIAEVKELRGRLHKLERSK